jgi:hypothetical protein
MCAARAVWIGNVALALLSGCYLAHERAHDAARDDAARQDAGDDAPRTDAGCEPPLGTLVALTIPHPHSMESTEVTREAYARFLACVGAPVCGMHSSCAQHFDDGAAPMVCVSACEARAYCAWAGRRLCAEDEWRFACAATARRVAPDDRIDDPHACVLAAFADDVWSFTPPRDAVRDTGSATDCRGDVAPYDRIFDLIGNASEIVQNAAGAVGVQGTNVASGFIGPCLPVAEIRGVDDAEGLVGFRCCAD